MTPSPEARLVALPDGSEFPLPADAEVVPVVEEVYVGFATGLSEPEMFDFYAAWLGQRGWQQQAPTKAMITPPHQRWRKGDVELLIELQPPDEQGRTVVWVQVSSLALPSPTAVPDTSAPRNPWTNYTNGNELLALAAADGTIWAGTRGGAVRWNTADGSYTNTPATTAWPATRYRPSPSPVMASSGSGPPPGSAATTGRSGPPTPPWKRPSRPTTRPF